MPFLAYETDGTSYAGRLTGRALIGRRLSHGVVLAADPAVNRLHAWVDPTPDGGWAVTDAGSKGGVTVNGRRIDRQVLTDGDVIGVGSIRVTFRTADDPPPGAEPAVLTPPAGERVHTGGILFDCEHCRAPIWVGHELAGKRGRCRHCQQRLTVPTSTPTSAAPTPAVAPAGRRPHCGVCHAAIAAGEDMTTCPECDTTYHAECWTENYGCSTYGCGQVNALNVGAAAHATPVEPSATPTPAAAVPAESRTQWEWVTVLATLLASAVGAVAFGVPALAMAVVAAVMIARRRPGTRVGLLGLAVAVAVVGTVVGLAGSDYLYLGGRHLP